MAAKEIDSSQIFFMRSPFVDFTVLDAANNAAAETAFEFESPFINNENYAAGPEAENLYLSDVADFEHLIINQFMRNGWNGVLPDQFFCRYFRAEIPDTWPHITVS